MNPVNPILGNTQSGARSAEDRGGGQDHYAIRALMASAADDRHVDPDRVSFHDGMRGGWPSPS